MDLIVIHYQYQYLLHDQLIIHYHMIQKVCFIRQENLLIIECEGYFKLIYIIITYIKLFFAFLF